MVLFLLNVTWWFHDPFSPTQLVAWLLLVACMVPLIWGVVLLRRLGKPAQERPSDDTLVALEKTTQLVSTGLYHYIRHPLYTSLLMLAVGVFFKRPNWLGALIAVLAILFLNFTAQVEEQENIAFFGQDYQEYQSKTKMFIPFIY